MQSTQQIESINGHIHEKVDRTTSLYDLLLSIKNYVKNEEHLEKFTIGIVILNTRFFGPMDSLIKEFLMSVMLGKQRIQMNQSVCYNVNRITLRFDKYLVNFGGFTRVHSESLKLFICHF